jgi:type IV secretion system protein VirB3
MSLTIDPVYLALTRPAMVLGVSYTALLVNMILTAELFLVTRSLPWLLVCVPVHGLQWLLCQQEPRIFELVSLWGRTRAPALLGNFRHWRASGYSPLGLRRSLSAPRPWRRRREVWVVVMPRGPRFQAVESRR